MGFNVWSATHCYGANHHGWYGKHNRVEDEDVFDAPEHVGRVHQQVQPRVEHPALRHHHDEPREVDERDGRHGVLPHAKVGEDDEERLQDDAPRRECAGPKVQPAPPLEDEEQRRVDLDANVPRDADEGGHGHGQRQVVPDVVHGEAQSVCSRRWRMSRGRI